MTDGQGDGQADDDDHGQDHRSYDQDVKGNGGRNRELVTGHDDSDQDGNDRPEPGARPMMLRITTLTLH